MKRKLKAAERFALTSVAAAALCLASTTAAALGLGRLNVQSSLGEVLRAEIEVTSLSAEEQASLRIRVAPPESYRAANVDYNPVLPSTRATFERRADGRLFVRLVSDRGVQEPFVDVILEISWATGRLVREYTLLFDPPATVRAGAAPSAQTAPVMSAAPPAPQPIAPSGATAAAREAREAREMARAEAREAARAEARERRAASRASADAAPRTSASTTTTTTTTTTTQTTTAAGVVGDEYRVRPGDSLSRIAGRVNRQNASLDQMLAALYRANPSAFINSNINKLKSGVVLAVPKAAAAQAIPQAEARQTIIAQSSDFGAYRQRLASGATATPRVEPSARQATGRVQAAVEDKKPAPSASPDRLTLSRGGVVPPAPAGSAAEDRLSSARSQQAAASRVAELNRNLNDLRRLPGGASAPAGTAPGATATPATQAPSAAATARPPVTAAPVPPVATAPTPPVATAPTPPVAAAPTPPVATAPATSPAPATPAPTPPVVAAPASAVTVPPVVATAPTPAPAPAASTPPTTVASTASAAASAPVTARAPASAAVATKPPTKPAVKPAGEPSFIDSLTDNPLYLGVGALALLLAGYGLYRVSQRSKKESGETSFLESRLQPDSFFGASGGQRIDTRDAAGSSSSMTYSLSQLDAIGDVDPVAEADVYLAYGRDLQAEEILKEAMRANPERLAIRTKLLEVYAKRRDIKGFELLATQLYALTRGEGEEWTKAQELGATIDPDNALYRAGGAPERHADMGTGSGMEALGASTLPQSIMPNTSAFGSTQGSLDTVGRDSQIGTLDLDLDDPDVGTPSRPAPLGAAEPTPVEPNSHMATTLKMPLVVNEPTIPDHRDEPLTFDLSGISLDLDEPAVVADGDKTEGRGDGSGGDPLARKLELAEEFQRIGDKDGARDLLREVLATASGATKTKAQGMLDAIS